MQDNTDNYSAVSNENRINSNLLTSTSTLNTEESKSVNSSSDRIFWLIAFICFFFVLIILLFINGMSMHNEIAIAIANVSNNT